MKIWLWTTVTHLSHTTNFLDLALTFGLVGLPTGFIGSTEIIIWTKRISHSWCGKNGKVFLLIFMFLSPQFSFKNSLSFNFPRYPSQKQLKITSPVSLFCQESLLTSTFYLHQTFFLFSPLLVNQEGYKSAAFSQLYHLNDQNEDNRKRINNLKVLGF